jgi:hypothetical protein
MRKGLNSVVETFSTRSGHATMAYALWLIQECRKMKSSLNHGNPRGGERMKTKKEVYVPPVLTKHELLRDITAAFSGGGRGGAIKGTIGDIVCRVAPRNPHCD